MNQPTGGDIPSPDAKLCECGCGRPAPIAQFGSKSRGWVKGQPVRFVWGHGSRKPGAQARQRNRKPRPDTGERKPNGNTRMFVEVGQRFGYGVVIDPDARIKFPSSLGPGKRAARLLCDCGNEYVKDIRSLVGVIAGTAQSLSCGCMGRGSVIDRTGQRFGKVVIVKFAGIRQRKGRRKGQGGATWLCRCDCGNELVVTTANLTGTRSCGCGRRRPHKGRPAGSVARNKALASYMRGARQRDLAWELTDEDFYRLAALDCYYCGAPPSVVFSDRDVRGLPNLPTAGSTEWTADRATRSRTSSRAAPLATIAKRDMPFDAFMEWIGRLVAHHWFRPEQLPSAAIREPALRVVKDGDVA